MIGLEWIAGAVAVAVIVALALRRYLIVQDHLDAVDRDLGRPRLPDREVIHLVDRRGRKS